MSIAIKEIARFEKEVIVGSQKRETDVEKAEQLALEDQFVPGFVEEAKMLRKRESSFETAARAKVLIGGQ